MKVRHANTQKRTRCHKIRDGLFTYHKAYMFFLPVLYWVSSITLHQWSLTFLSPRHLMRGEIELQFVCPSVCNYFVSGAKLSNYISYGYIYHVVQMYLLGIKIPGSPIFWEILARNTFFFQQFSCFQSRTYNCPSYKVPVYSKLFCRSWVDMSSSDDSCSLMYPHSNTSSSTAPIMFFMCSFV